MGHIGITVPCLAIAWLTGICLASVLKVPGWILGLAVILPLAISLLWWREWRARLGAASALFLILGALRYQLALPTFDEGSLAHYNGRGQVTVIGVVADEPDVRDRYVNLRVASGYLELEDQRREVDGLVLVRTGRYPLYAYGDQLRIQA